MDNIIYQYLIKNENKNIDNQNENDIFLDSLLILSINKINIDFNTLLDYCGKVIKNNNNNKRNLYSDKEDCLYFGLNKYQFQILYKIIESLNGDQQNISGGINIQSILDKHSNSNSIFDCSIIIIIKNNLKLQSNNNNNNHLSKKIKLNNTTISQPPQQQNYQQINNRNIEKNNYKIYNDYNYILFKQIWGNIIIRNEILFHLRLFNLHNDISRMDFINYRKNLRNYKYNNYLNNLVIFGTEKEEDEQYDVFTVEDSKFISSSVTKLELLDFSGIEEGSIPNTVNSLRINGTINQKLVRELFHNRIIGSDNITTLVFGYQFNQPLGCGINENEPWLPRNLRSLKFGKFFQQSIYPGQLPYSLTSLKFHEDYQGTIAPNSIPKSVTTLDLEFSLNEIIKHSIPKSITRLQFNDDFNQRIKIGDIPHNVTSLKFGCNFNSTIKPGSLPLSLRSLEFGKQFNKPIIENTLPPNLTSLIFGDYFSESIDFNNHNCFPPSITQLELGFSFNQQPIEKDTFKNLSILKKLRIGDMDSAEFEIGSLPNSIESLELSAYEYFTEPGFLPKSLTYLSSKYPEKIPNSLPTNLKSIAVPCLGDYDLPLDWPASIETIYIDKDTHNFCLFDKVPTDFLLKYIKPANLKQ